MQLSCEVCGSSLRAEDVRLDIAVAKCHACNAVYDLSGRKSRGMTPAAREKPAVRPKAALPERFKVEEDYDTTRISWRWLGLKHLFLTFFCVAWDSFLVFWYGIALSTDNTPWLMLVFPLAHVAVGVGLTYSVLTGWINRTRIEVRRDRLSIRHGPLPWKRNQEFNGRELTQLYGEEIPTVSKGQRTGSTYDLVALDRSGRKVKLLTGLDDRDQTLWLEQTLERRLGIEDSPVDGEIAPRTRSA